MTDEQAFAVDRCAYWIALQGQDADTVFDAGEFCTAHFAPLPDPCGTCAWCVLSDEVADDDDPGLPPRT